MSVAKLPLSRNKNNNQKIATEERIEKKILTLRGIEPTDLALLMSFVLLGVTSEIVLLFHPVQNQTQANELIQILLLMLILVALWMMAKRRAKRESQVYEWNEKPESSVIKCVVNNPEFIACSQELKAAQAAKQELERKLVELQKVEKTLRETQERYALASLAANEGLWDWNLKTNQIYFSPRWKSLLGYEEHEITNSPDEWFSRVRPEEIERVKVELATHAEGITSFFQSAYPMLHKDGTYHWMLSRGIAVTDSEGKVYRITGVQTDITERKVAEEQLVYDAFHDGLTGLPNRALFRDRLSHIIEVTKRREDYLFAVLFLDFDRFKVINDSLGHMVGDQLLIAIAQRLKNCLRSADTVARFGGDEFAILLEDIKDTNAAIEVADRIQQELALPFNLNQQEVFTTTSIGIALSSTGYIRPEDFLRDADTAMYRAKALGKSRYVVFDQAMHTRAVTLLQLENDLRRAIERQQFQIHYQPIVSLKNGKLT